MILLQVKILVNKPGTAMAHLDNPQGAKNAIHHLHGHQLMGSTLELKWACGKPCVDEVVFIPIFPPVIHVTVI